MLEAHGWDGTALQEGTPVTVFGKALEQAFAGATAEAPPAAAAAAAAAPPAEKAQAAPAPAAMDQSA